MTPSYFEKGSIGRQEDPELVTKTEGESWSRKVLVIEDDSSIVSLLGLALRNPFESVDNIAQALRVLERVKPTWILLDLEIFVSEKDRDKDPFGGVKILQGIIADPDRYGLPHITLFSSDSSVAEKMYGGRNGLRKMGIKGFLKKPFDLDEITTEENKVFENE